MIVKFTNETKEKLDNYVYRLVDPRNGNTFYVGRGVGDRVFAHVRDASNYYSGEFKIKENDDEDEFNLKFNIIKDIKKAGLDIIHIIHRHGLNEETAKEVEAALIDCYLPTLSNIQNGERSNDYGVANVQEVNERYSLETYDDNTGIKYIIIKTSYARMDLVPGTNDEEKLLRATSHEWKINRNKAKDYPYVLSVINGVVKEVYEVDNGGKGWFLFDDGRGRNYFKGKIANDEIRKHFVGYLIPDRFKKKGMASPVLYSDSNER